MYGLELIPQTCLLNRKPALRRRIYHCSYTKSNETNLVALVVLKVGKKHLLISAMQANQPVRKRARTPTTPFSKLTPGKTASLSDKPGNAAAPSKTTQHLSRPEIESLTETNQPSLISSLKVSTRTCRKSTF